MSPENGSAPHLYKPGTSGNPGGRPRGLARVTREKVGNEGEAIVQLWMNIMEGKVERVRPDGKTVVVDATIKEMLEASRLLAERGWGKPAQFQLIEDADPLETNQMEQDAAVERFRAEVVRLAPRTDPADTAAGNGASSAPDA